MGLDDMVDFLTMEEVIEQMSTTSTKLRRSLFRFQVLRIFKDLDGDDEEAQKVFSKQVITCIFLSYTWVDNASLLVVNKAIEALVSNQVFLVEFASAFLARMKKITPKMAAVSYPKNLLRYLSWSIHLVAPNGPEKMKILGNKTTEALVESQCKLIEGLKAHTRFEASTKNTFIRLLQRNSGLVPLFVKTVTSGISTSKYMHTMKFLLAFLSGPRHTETLKPLLAELVKKYNTVVLGSSTKVPKSTRDSFTPLFSRLTHEQIEGVLVPTINRMLKRSTDTVLSMMVPILSNVAVDLSRYAKPWFSTFLNELRSTDAGRQKVGLQLIQQIAVKSSDPDALKGMLSEIGDNLLGKPKPLSSNSMKLNFLQAIACMTLAVSAGSSALIELAGIATDFLMKYISKEGQKEPKQMAVVVLGKWAQVYGYDEVPETVATFLVTGLMSGANQKQIEPVVSAYIKSLLSLMDGDDEHPVLFERLCEQKVSDTLFKYIKAAELNPNKNRVAGLLSMALLLRSGSRDIMADSEHVLAKQWLPFLASGNSFINNPEYVVATPYTDVKAHLDLASATLMCHFPMISQHAVGTYAPFFEGLCYQLFHLNPKARMLARSVVMKLVRSDPGITSRLVPAFHSVLHSDVFQKYRQTLEDAKQKSEEIISEEDAPKKKVVCPVITPFMLARTLSTISYLPESNMIGMIGLCAHNPLLMVQPEVPDRLWQQLLQMWQREGHNLDIDLALEENIDTIRSILLTSEGLFSEDWTKCAEICNFLSSVSKRVPFAVIESVLPECLDILRSDLLVNMTPYQNAVFFTEDDVLCNFNQAGVYQAEVVKSHNVKRTKGSMYSAEDEAWEREVAEELAKKKGSSKPSKGSKNKGKGKPSGKPAKAKDGKAEKEAQLLKEEQKLRVDVTNEITKVNAVLNLFRSFARYSPIVTHDYLIPNANALVTALMSTLLVEEAVSLHNLFGSCMDPEMRKIAPTISLAIQTILKDGPKAFQTYPVQLLLENSLSLISEACAENLFTGPTFLYCFTLVKECIMNSDDGQQAILPGIKSALEIIQRHCTAAGPNPDELEEKQLFSVPYPNDEIIVCLLHLLQSVASLEGAAQFALGDLCPLLSTANIETLISDAGLLNVNENVRMVSLQAIGNIPDVNPPFGTDLTARLWVSCHDTVQDVARTAQDLWVHLNGHLPADYLPPFLDLLSHKEACVRTSVGLAIAAAAQLYPETLYDTVDGLLDLFENSPDQIVVQDTGISLRTAQTKYNYNWPTRSGVANALEALVPNVEDDELLVKVFEFALTRGLADSRDEVWNSMLEFGLKLIDVHGSEKLHIILPILERRLDELNQAKLGAGAGQADRIREGVVVLMGTSARHLGKEDPKVFDVVMLLIEVLKTPSASVQESVSKCLSPLMPYVKGNAQELVERILHDLAKGESYGERKGAAYGLAGMVKGLKLSSLKKYSILDKLAETVKDKKSAKAREGALFAYERLFATLGSSFEPYVVHVLPHLLACHGDSSPDVREATAGAAKQIMANLTGHGVKMVLPLVLNSLEEGKQWRTKLESISLLGSMAYCAPRQLSGCLPQIVPRLLEVIADPHIKVQGAATSALTQIGNVIRNPEIQQLVPVILSALADPSNHTKTCLQHLMKTSFVHSVDPASLALIIPILRRGLMDRSPSTKKMAAQVVGSICSLISDVKDILPYSKTLLKYLKIIIVDPIPEVRAIGSRSLGALYKGIGEEHFTDLVDYLFDLLSSDVPVQRSGAGQSLAHVLYTLGNERTQELMPFILEQSQRPDSPIHREGFIGMFAFFPEPFGEDFGQFLPQCLPVVLEALADETGLVREEALKGGQVIVSRFAVTDTDAILSALEDGILHEKWRIRLSSMQLLGTFLLKIAGAKGKLMLGPEELDDESVTTNVPTKHQEKLVERILTTERRNLLFAQIYLLRSDVMISVGQMAWRVFNCVVQNTPRMLATVLPTLMNKIIFDLASSNPEKQAAAGAAVGNLVKRLGDGILQEIVPILLEKMDSYDPSCREGVCMGLGQVLASASKNHIGAYLPDIIPAIRDALCDPELEVRQAAGRAFSTLHRNVGRKAIDEIVPGLIEKLDTSNVDDEDEDAEPRNNEVDGTLVVAGVREVLSICSRDVLPLLIPQLIQTPLSLFHARALGLLAPVFGPGFNRFVAQVVQTFIGAVADSADDEEKQSQIMAYADQVFLAINQESVEMLMDALTAGIMKLSENKPETRAACGKLLTLFLKSTSCDLEPHIDDLFEAIFEIFAEEDEKLRNTGWSALDALTTAQPKEVLFEHIPFVRHVIRNIVNEPEEPLTSLPGLSMKKGLAPLLPMFQHGLLNGSPSLRKDAAEGLGEMIELTQEKFLAPFVIKITGPLIRIVGDRFPPEVKAAILGTLGLLINKSGRYLKPFLPQLQTTFLKALNDSSSVVRDCGGTALISLMTQSRRVDPVITELATNIETKPSIGVKTSMLTALSGVLSNEVVGKKVSAEVMDSTRRSLMNYMESDKDSIRREAARVIGITSLYIPEDQLSSFAGSLLQYKNSDSWYERDGGVNCISSLLKNSFDRLDADLIEKIVAFAEECMKDDNVAVKDSAVACLGQLILSFAMSENEIKAETLAKKLPLVMEDSVTQVRKTAFNQVQLLAETCPQFCLSLMPTFAPSLVTHIGDGNELVKKAVQQALYYTFGYYNGKAAATSALKAYATMDEDTELAAQLTTYCKKTVSKLKGISLL